MSGRCLVHPTGRQGVIKGIELRRGVEMTSCRSTIERRITPSKELEMQYLLLIYANEAEMAARTASALASMSAEYTEFTKGIIQAGQFKPGDRLRPTSAATTARGRKRQGAPTGGPLGANPEQLGGPHPAEGENPRADPALAARPPAAQRGRE